MKKIILYSILSIFIIFNNYNLHSEIVPYGLVAIESTHSSGLSNVTLNCACDDPENTVILDGTIPGGLSISQLENMGYDFDWATACIIVKGQFNFDIDFNMVSSDILFESGASMIVESGVSLTIRESTLKGCINLWKGIILENDGSLDLNNSSIEDAEYAVNIKGDANFNSSEVIYKNNYVGIYAEPSAELKNINGNPLGLNHFVGEGDLLPAYQGSEIGYQQYTLAGIYLNNVTHLSIGYRVFPVFQQNVVPNYFDDIRNGIMNINSGVTVVGAYIDHLEGFYDVKGEAYYEPKMLSGIGIYSKDNISTLVRDSKTTDVHNAICCVNSNIDIFDNNFNTSTSSNISTALYLIDGSLKTLLIENNELASWEVGIHAKSIQKPVDFKIEGNELQNSSIFIFDSDYGLINNNDLYGGYIYLWNGDNFTVSSNDITQLSIMAGGDNDVIVNTMDIVHYFGLAARGSDNNTFYCNTIKDNIHNGVLFWGTNVFTLFKGNTIENCANSFVLRDAEIGPQRFSGNVWIGQENVGVIESVNGTLGSQEDIALKSQFTVNPADLPLQGGVEPPSYDPPVIEDDWFKPQTWEDNQFCDPVNPWVIDTVKHELCEKDPKPWWLELDCNELANLLDKSMFTAIESPYKNQYIWQKQKYIFRKLSEYPQLRDSCTYIDSIMQGFPSKDIFDYVQVELKIDEIFIPTLVDCDSLEIFRDTLDSLIIQISIIDSLLMADSLNSDNELLQKVNYLAQVQTISTDYLNFSKTATNEQLTNLLAVRNNANMLITKNIYEITQKRYWQLSIKVRLEGLESLNTSEWSEIQAMAQLCPLEAGNAVYGARYLYGLVDPAASYDDMSICGFYTVPAILMETKEWINKQSISFFPNPSNDNWTFNMQNPDKKSILVELTDIEGRLIQNYDFGHMESINKKVGTRDLLPGIYFAKVYRNGVLSFNQKLIKIQ